MSDPNAPAPRGLLNWWQGLILAISSAIIGVAGAVAVIKGTGASTGSGPSWAMMILRFVPHFLMLFGILADAFTYEGVYWTGTMVGVVSIFAGPMLDYIGKGFMGLAAKLFSKGTPPPPTGGGEYPGCEIMSETAVATGSPQTLTVTASILSYYIHEPQSLGCCGSDRCRCDLVRRTGCGDFGCCMRQGPRSHGCVHVGNVWSHHRWHLLHDYRISCTQLSPLWGGRWCYRRPWTHGGQRQEGRHGPKQRIRTCGWNWSPGLCVNLHLSRQRLPSQRVIKDDSRARISSDLHSVLQKHNCRHHLNTKLGGNTLRIIVGIHANEMDAWKLLNEVSNSWLDCCTRTTRRRPKMVSYNWRKRRHTLYREETRKQLLCLLNVNGG